IDRKVAVKAFRLLEHYDLETVNRNISREIGILRILRHNNIVPLWGIATGFGRMPELRCLVSPWMPNGTLTAYLTSNRDDLTVLDRSRMLEDVSAGLRYLHSESVIHGDITGANILIDRRGHARLIDFGLSTIVQPLIDQSHLAISSVRHGAIRYAAPELVLSDDTHESPVPLEKTDIYSFGCVMLEVLSGRLPWSEIRREVVIRTTMLQGRGPQRPDCHLEIVDSDWNFIQKCLQSGPELRPSAEKVLEFVTHRLSSPDSCSRPPDDPSDDTPDDFPGASPHGGSDDSDTLEQPPDSPPLHSDHKLKTLVTVADNSSASTSSAPAISVPAFSYNDTGVSNTSEPTDHSLEEFQCTWEGPKGLYCNDRIRDRDFPSHLREVHVTTGPASSIVTCRWRGCNMALRKDCLWRHVKEKHLGIRRGGGKIG
ncbi:kinase-like domain-containing protein, partial [Suillus occidentalis]